MLTESSAPSLDFDACYRAASGRDARWDGRIYLCVTSTGIYCRPSCPARKPRPENCRFLPSAAACVAAGFRACKRCRPDALPGSRDWDVRGDLVARAVRRIRDGAVDAVGVSGLAAELAVSERHLRRMLLQEIGATPLQLARTRRAHAARSLIEQTELPLADIAFAAGFGSLRQFGDTMREEFGIAPSRLARPASRGAGDPREPASDERPKLALRLRTRAPFAAAATRSFLAAHAIPGRDLVGADGTTSHAIDVPGGTAVVRIDWPAVPESGARRSPGGATVGIPILLSLPGLSDAMPAIQTVRRLLDLDADPGQVAEALGSDPLLAASLAARPGLRLPGARDPGEFALGTVLGQQVSLAAARTLQGRLAAAFAESSDVAAADLAAAAADLAAAAAAGAAAGGAEARDAADAGSGAGIGVGTGAGVTRAGAVGTLGASPCDPPPVFHSRPSPARIAETGADVLRERLGLTRARAETLRAVAGALAAGLDLGPGADRAHARRELLAIRGIGAWSTELIAMRALGDPDAYPAGDLILRRALGVRGDREAVRLAEPWRPFRGYATQHLWADFLETAAHAARKVPQ